MACRRGILAHGEYNGLDPLRVRWVGNGMPMAVNSYWHRAQRLRISRRRLLATGGAGAAGFLAVTAFGGVRPAKGEGPGREGTPRYGGRYQTAVPYDFDTLDPHLPFPTAPFLARVYNVLLARSAA